MKYALMIAAVVLFAIAAFMGPAGVYEPYYGRLIAAGLFCWSLSVVLPH